MGGDGAASFALLGTATRNSCDPSSTWPGPTRPAAALVMDNYPAHKRVEIRDRLTANHRVHAHFTPTSASWLNLVEVWLGVIERQAIHRSTFANVRELTSAIKTFITGWNNRAHLFVWTKTAIRSSQKLTWPARPAGNLTGLLPCWLGGVVVGGHGVVLVLCAVGEHCDG